MINSQWSEHAEFKMQFWLLHAYPNVRRASLCMYMCMSKAINAMWNIHKIIYTYYLLVSNVSPLADGIDVSQCSYML